MCNGTCNCNFPFTGNNCSQCLNYCVNGSPSGPNCACQCNSPFTLSVVSNLPTCTVCNTTAANILMCKGRGSVTSSCTSCVCSELWSGDDCGTCAINDSICHKGYADNTTCSCVCQSSWMLNATTRTCTTCNTTAGGLLRCNGRGTASPDTCSTPCTCRDGWGGSLTF